MKIKSFIIAICLLSLPLQATELRYSFPVESSHTMKALPSAWWPFDDDQEPDELDLSDVLSLEGKLLQTVLGQDEAVRTTSKAIIRFAAGVNDPNRPIATFLYAGPTGVGKTELAKQLCSQLFGSDRFLTTLNMSEYSQEWTISRLLGSAPGYIDSDKGGQLTEAIKSYPYSIVLLDEIDKAHPKVLKVFLRMFDEGVITSAMGENINCRNCIFILTTNFSASKILRMSSLGAPTEEILAAVEPDLVRVLSPELYNRLEPVIFRGLPQEVMEDLVTRNLEVLKDRIYERKKILLEFDASIIDYLALHGYHPELGARPLKRLIEKDLTTVIAEALLEGKFSSGDKMVIYYSNGEVVIKKS